MVEMAEVENWVEKVSDSLCSMYREPIAAQIRQQEDEDYIQARMDKIDSNDEIFQLCYYEALEDPVAWLAGNMTKIGDDFKRKERSVEIIGNDELKEWIQSNPAEVCKPSLVWINLALRELERD